MDCMVDTGFSGGIILPWRYASYFKEKPIMYQEFELADGSRRKYPIYKLKIRFNNLSKEVNLSFTDSKDSFVGIEFLLGFRFILDLKRFKVSLE